MVPHEAPLKYGIAGFFRVEFNLANHYRCSLHDIVGMRGKLF